MKRIIQPMKIVSAAAIVVCLLTVCRFPSRPMLAGTTEPASAPATATAPAVPEVRWLAGYKPAAEQADRENALLLVVYTEPESPACQAFEYLALKRASVRRFLASFSAVKLDIASVEGRGRFAKTGAKETPLTRVFTPKGELLDNIPGCIIPASAFLRRLEYSRIYSEAVGRKPFGPAAQWEAVQARLKLSTRAKAAPVIDKLLKIPVRKMPPGATPARLHLAKGKALMFAKPAEAAGQLKNALKLGAADDLAGGEAMLALARLAERDEHYKQAHEYCRRYIRAFPAGASIGRAYYAKAVLEFQALDDQAAAVKTLGEFVQKYSHDPRVVDAKRLLKMTDPASTEAPTTAPATAPAAKDKTK